MADQITKEQCSSIEEASKQLKVSKATLYNYMNILNIQRLRFGFDRKTYIKNEDVKRIQEFTEKNRG
jgi:transposase